MLHCYIKAYFFICFICNCNGYSYPNNVVEELKWSLTPSEFASHLESRLSSREARFISQPCVQDLWLYLKGLKGLRLWALQMFDAYAKLPSGLLRGHGAALGSFEECLKVKDETSGLRGKYCLGRLNIASLADSKEIGPFSANSKAPRLGDFQTGVISIPWGVCLPSKCSAKDVQWLHSLFVLRFSEKECQTESSIRRDFDGGDIGTMFLLATVTSLILSSTIYDVITFYLCIDCGWPVLRSFSVFSNVMQMTKIKSNPDAIGCIYGIRTLTGIFTIYGFSYVTLIFSPLINWIDALQWLLDKDKAFLLDAFVCIDTFILVSGILVSYNFLKSKGKGLQFNIIHYYLKRFLRLTPPLAVAILVHSTLLRHTGTGPLWPKMRDSWLVNNCRENWWHTLLYVQNYATGDMRKLCILQASYLSIDMQIYLLSPLVLIPLKKAPKYTISAIVFLLVCSMVSSFLTGWEYQLKAVFATNGSLLEILNYLKYFYFPMHTRACSWLIGFVVGYVIYYTQKPNARIKLKQELNILLATLFWIITIGILVFCVCIGREIMPTSYNWIIHAFHLSFIRPLWAIAISWIIFACVHGYAGPINWFLSSPFFEVLSRITYSTFLLNVSVMFIITLQTATGLEFTDTQVFYNFTEYVFVTFAIGFLWTLAFESPMISLINIFLRQEKGEDVLKILKSNTKKM